MVTVPVPWQLGAPTVQRPPGVVIASKSSQTVAAHSAPRAGATTTAVAAAAQAIAKAPASFRMG
ncbi:hypothetical protein GCM10027199_17690 [Amycolatopsis magusensis]